MSIEDDATRVIEEAVQDYLGNTKAIIVKDLAELMEFRPREDEVRLHHAIVRWLHLSDAAKRQGIDRDDAWRLTGKPGLLNLVGWAALGPLGEAGGTAGYGKLANLWLSGGWPRPSEDDDESDEDPDDEVE